MLTGIARMHVIWIHAAAKSVLDCILLQLEVVTDQCIALLWVVRGSQGRERIACAAGL